MSSTWEKNENFENSQIYLFHSYYYSAYLPVLKNVFIVEKYWFFENLKKWCVSACISWDLRTMMLKTINLLFLELLQWLVEQFSLRLFRRVIPEWWCIWCCLSNFFCIRGLFFLLCSQPLSYRICWRLFGRNKNMKRFDLTKR